MVEAVLAYVKREGRRLRAVHHFKDYSNTLVPLFLKML